MSPEEEYDEEIEEEDETFECRVCNKEVTHEDGDDNLLICDSCAEKYNLEKIWDDYEADRLSEDDLRTCDLTPYKL